MVRPSLHNAPHSLRVSSHSRRNAPHALPCLRPQFEDVEFVQPTDGSTLRGWFIDRRGAAKTGDAAREGLAVVFVHGGGRDRRAFLRHVPMVCGESGFSAVLYDARGHGASDLDHVGLSYGIREHEDAMAAADWVRKSRGFEKVVIFGTSVGAYSSILAASKLPYETVAGVIAENPFASIRAQVSGMVLNLAWRKVLCRGNERLVRLTAPVRHFVDAMVWLLVARGLGKQAHCPTLNASNVIHRIKQPLLLMHGTADTVINHWHAQDLYERAQTSTKAIWIAKDADHCALLNVHPEEYRRRVMSFLQARYDEYADHVAPGSYGVGGELRAKARPAPAR